MRQITKDIEITIDGNAVGFRLTKLDAFSGVTLLRLLMRLEGQTVDQRKEIHLLACNAPSRTVSRILRQNLITANEIILPLDHAEAGDRAANQLLDPFPLRRRVDILAADIERALDQGSHVSLQFNASPPIDRAIPRIRTDLLRQDIHPLTSLQILVIGIRRAGDHERLRCRLDQNRIRLVDDRTALGKRDPIPLPFSVETVEGKGCKIGIDDIRVLDGIARKMCVSR